MKRFVKCFANEVVLSTVELYNGFTKAHAAMFGLLGMIALLFIIFSPRH